MRLEVLFPEKGQARVEIIDWPARGSLGRLLYFKRFAWYPSFFLALIIKDETWEGLTAACLVTPDGPSGTGPRMTRCSSALCLVTGSEMETYFRMS